MSTNNINARCNLTEKLVVLNEGKKNVVSNPWKPAINVENVKRVSAYVDDIEANLIRTIETHGNGSLLVGCVAWLSNPRIIDAIAKYCRAVLLLVNDENYAVWGNGKVTELYTRLPGITQSLKELFGHLDSPLGHMDNKNYAPVRCMRNVGDALMHSKYVIFFKPMAFETEYGFIYKDIPFAVWTGSVNYTVKASRNKENAVFIESELIARFFFHDFANIFMHSGQLRLDGPSSTNQVNNDAPSYRPPNRFMTPITPGIAKKKTKPPVRRNASFAKKTKSVLMNYQ